MIYQSNKKYTSWVVYSFIIFSILSLILVLLDIRAIVELSQYLSVNTPELNEKLTQTLTWDQYAEVGTAIIYMLCAIIFLFWMYRTSQNLHALHPEKKFNYSPRLAIGSFFIPILNIYWPYQAIKEIWQSSEQDELKRMHTFHLLNWWICFIVFNTCARILNKMPMETPSNLNIYLYVDLFANIIGIIAALLTVKIVKEITQNLEKHAHARKA